MSSLPFGVSDRYEAKTRPRGPKTTVREEGSGTGRAVKAAAVLLACGATFAHGYSFGTRQGDDAAPLIASADRLDERAVGSIPRVSLRPVRASWTRDLAACAKRMTGGGHFTKSNGIVRVGFGEDVPTADRVLIEQRMVACMAGGKPGKFCDADYRDAFVAFANGPAWRAGTGRPVRATIGGETISADPLPIVRASLRAVMRTGAVQPGDFRAWWPWGAKPGLVDEVAAATGVPPRPC